MTILTMTAKEIAKEVSEKFNFTTPSDYTDWSDLKNNDKIPMVQFAHALVLAKNLPVNKLVNVFDYLNVDINTTGYKCKIRGNVYKFLPKKRIIKNNKTKTTTDRYLNNLDNSQEAKVLWLLDKIKEGEANSKKKKGDSGRGGAFSYGPQALRTELKERFIEFAANHLPDYCPVTKCKLDYGRYPKSRGYDDTNKEHQKHRASLDRHDPTIGYTFDNCRVLSKLGNTLKGNGTMEEIKALYEYMMNG